MGPYKILRNAVATSVKEEDQTDARGVTLKRLHSIRPICAVRCEWGKRYLHITAAAKKRYCYCTGDFLVIVRKCCIKCNVFTS